MAVKRISVVGATGSIGMQVANVIRREGNVKVVGLACNDSIDRLESMISEFKPEFVAVKDGIKAKELAYRLRRSTTWVFPGQEGALNACVKPDVDLVIIASVGLDSFKTTLEAVRLGRNIAPASKEPFVLGSEVILPIALKNHVQVRPVDSELSAIWQIMLEHNLGSPSGNGGNCVVGVDTSKVERVWLGCSGGPFYGSTLEGIRHVTRQQVLRHPTWSMGQLVTTNSATLENKAQEMGETRAMFNLRLEQIEAVIDRTSNLHAMVQFSDGTILAHRSKPNMEDAIRFAIYGIRNPKDIQPADGIRLEKPDYSTFWIVGRMREALKRGGTMPAVHVAANDTAVASFHSGKIRFTGITDLVDMAMKSHRQEPATEESIVGAYGWGIQKVRSMIRSG